MTRLNPSNTSHTGIDTIARTTNSRPFYRSLESPRARQTMPSANRMNPVQAIGVFHDQNGSMRASVAPSDTTISASPIQAVRFT